MNVSGLKKGSVSGIWFATETLFDGLPFVMGFNSGSGKTKQRNPHAWPGING